MKTIKLTQAQQLISEAVFCELNNHQWPKGLWNSLKEFINELESTYLDNLDYSEKFPGSPDANLRVKALGRILDSVSESCRSMAILNKRGAK